MKKIIAGLAAAATLLTGAAILSACGGGEKPVQQHVCLFSQTWQSDETYHWHGCTVTGCGEVDGYVFHSFKDGACFVCGASVDPLKNLLYTLSADGESYIVSGCADRTSESIDIPSVHNGKPVTAVGELAFAHMENLKSVTIPYGVTSIGSCAFEGCASLEEIILPQSVISIGSAAFHYCGALKNVTVPYGVDFIGENAFFACPVENAIIPAAVCESVKNPALRTVEITSGEAIGEWAFHDCKNLKSVKIPYGLTTIGGYAFLGCVGLTDITLPDSVTSIGSGAFGRCISLASVTIPVGVTSIGHATFAGCEKLSDITIPVGVTSIGDIAFSGCAFTSIIIPDSVNTVGYEAFVNCPIESAEIPAAACRAVNSSALKKVVITSGEVIGEYAFYGCENLSDITFPEGLTSIGHEAFADCVSLENISLPDSVTDIASTALRTTAWYENQPDGLVYAGKVAYSHKGETPQGTSVTLAEGTKAVADGAFGTGLTSITVPASVIKIGKYAFYGCSELNGVTVASGNTYYHSAGNCLIETASKTLLAGCNTSVIPTDGSVTVIGDRAFYGRHGLTSITIPDSVTTVGERAFNLCIRLTGITVPRGVTEIGTGAFSACGFKSITVASGNTYYHSAGNCLIETARKTLLATCETSSVPTDGSVIKIGEEAFASRIDLTSVTVPEGVISIGELAFLGCHRLTTVTVPQSVTSIGAMAFSGCDKLTKINFGGTRAQWNAVSKSDWDVGTGGCTICCSDGNI